MKMDVTLLTKEKIVIEGVTLDFYGAEFEGEDIPGSFVFYLLNKETREEARKMICQAKKLIKTREGVEKFLREAGEEGLNVAWKKLKSIEENQPTEQTKFYRSLKSKKRLVLIRKDRAFSFRTDVKIDNLPPNIYCEEERLFRRLDAQDLSIVKACLEEFFTFVKRLMDVRKIVYVGTGAPLEMFFTDRDRSYEMLAELERYSQFKRATIKCPHGYLLYKGTAHGWTYAWLVSPTGEVSVFARRGEKEMMYEVGNAVKGGEIARIKRAYPSEKELNNIAARIGKLDPALALVLMN